jgi:alkylation response protein AidB-like acyl-CoA dehydrogenase
MPTDIRSLTIEEVYEVDGLLTAERLSALMRSTWTWDDRALRRDLSALLVELDAARLVDDADVSPAAIAATLHARARFSGAQFVATVLGPKLVARGDGPLHDQFSAFASDPARFGRQARAARRGVAAELDDYLSRRLDVVDYAPESTWASLVANEGSRGLGEAMRAYGHGLSDSAFFASKALAWQAVSAVAGCETAATYARRLQADELTATLAAAEESASWDPALVRTRAVEDADKWRLTGAKNYVSAADCVDVVFVIARSIAGPSLFAVESGSGGLTVTPHPVVDGTRPLFGVTLSETPATLLGAEGSGGRLMSQLMDRATTALAAEQLGLIEAATGMVRATPRTADDELAEVVIDHAAAYALWQHALTAATPVAAAAAHIGCSAAAVRAATTAAELTEPDAGARTLLLRALSGSLLFGGPALSHERLLDRLGI